MPPHKEVSTVTIRRDEFDELRGDVKELLAEIRTDRTDVQLLKQRFGIVEKVVYGGVSLVLTSVGVAVIALVIVK